jgi:hypothetical protein
MVRRVSSEAWRGVVEEAIDRVAVRPDGTVEITYREGVTER